MCCAAVAHDEEIMDGDEEEESSNEEEEESSNEEEESSNADAFSESSLILTDTREITFYKNIRQHAVSLTQLYVTPEGKDKVSETVEWLSSALDGLVLGCTSSIACDDSSSSRPNVIPNEIELKPPPTNTTIVGICNALHINDATLDSTYPSEEMCQFRGKLKAIMIKFVVIHHACPNTLSKLVQQYEKSVNSIKDLVQSSDLLPTCIRGYCKTTLVKRIKRTRVQERTVRTSSSLFNLNVLLFC